MTWLLFSSFDFPNVTHGSFLRHGGTSLPPFASLNVGFHVGDNPDTVHFNRSSIKRALDFRCLLSTQQTHGNAVYTLSSPLYNDLEVEAFDALITDQPGVLLMVQQADCQAVFFYDPAQKVIGLSHVGWRGTVNGILMKTVRTMQHVFHCRPENLLAAISPSLGPCCAEFRHFHKELPEAMHSFQVRPAYFDFQAISRWQLINSGILPRNITNGEICSRCSDDFFSYRREGLTGRNASVIGLSQ